MKLKEIDQKKYRDEWKDNKMGTEMIPIGTWEGYIDFAQQSNLKLEQCLISIRSDRNISLNNASLKKLNNPLAVIISLNASLSVLSIRKVTETDNYNSLVLKILNASNDITRGVHLLV
jgi:hypothetical protein